MEQSRKRVTVPRTTAAFSVLLAGAALYTASDPERQGVQIKECAEAAETADGTIMVYTNGSDLEGDCGAATVDLWEMTDAFEVMEQEGKSPSLHVVVEAGGFTRWELDEMDSVPYARFSLAGDGILPMGSVEIRNTGDVDILTDLINYNVRSHPANHCGLILWNYGGGPVGGYGSDSHFGGNGPLLEEIRKALDHSVMVDNVFDFVAFGICLMGGVETAGCLDEYADYVVASLELEPQHGHDYRWMAALEDSLPPDMEWEEAVGRSMVEVYSACHILGATPAAMSLLDMKKYPVFHETFRQHVDGVPEKLWEELCGGLGGGRMKMLASDSRQADGPPELVDVLEFLNACQRIYPGKNVFQTLRDRIRRLVAKQWVKGYLMSPSGLTIYLSSGSNPHLSEALEMYGTTESCSACRRLIDGYAAYLVRESGAEWGDISAHKNGTVEINIAPKDASDVTGVHLTVFCPAEGDENYYFLCIDNDMDISVDGTLRVAPEDNYMRMKGQVPCLTEIMNLDTCTEYMIPVFYSGELCTMRVGFSEEHEDGQILSAMPADQTSEVARQIYELKEGDRMTPPYLAERVEDVEEAPGNTGNISGQIMEGRYYTDSYYMRTEFYIEEPDDMLLEAMPAPGDGYLYGLMLMDVQQNVYYTGFIGMGTGDNGL